MIAKHISFWVHEDMHGIFEKYTIFAVWSRNWRSRLPEIEFSLNKKFLWYVRSCLGYFTPLFFALMPSFFSRKSGLQVASRWGCSALWGIRTLNLSVKWLSIPFQISAKIYPKQDIFKNSHSASIFSAKNYHNLVTRNHNLYLGTRK